MGRLRTSFAAALIAILVALAPSVRADMEDVPYRVSRGDTGHRIARRFGMRLPELAALNPDVDLEHLRPGMELVVGHGFRHTHRVLPGEGVGAIAERWGVEARLLRAWNDLGASEAPDAGVDLVIFSASAVPPSASVGRPDHGSLDHGVVIPAHPAWRVRTPSRAYVTHYVAEALVTGFSEMRERHPDANRVEIRDASRRDGGALREHHSHQSGRDVDIAYLRETCREGLCGHHWTRSSELDAAAMWTLIHAWIERDLVEYVFVDHALQARLYEAARAAGASRAELSEWFQYPRGEGVRAGIIRHVPRHTDHFHVRFTCAPWDGACRPTDGSAVEHEEGEGDGARIARRDVSDSDG